VKKNQESVRVPASINPENGIVQVDAVIEGENFSFAMDNGIDHSLTVPVFSFIIRQ
jgi:hypothetical protein